MTDRTDAFDGDNGLEELDRHARAATEALLAQVNELVELGVEPDWSGGTPPAAMPAGSRVDEAVMDAHERNVIPLGHARGRPGAAGRRRFAVGCAAAVVALVAVGGALAVVDGDGGPDVRSGGPESVLLPGWLPDGFQPVMAVDLGSADLPGGLGGEIAIYGDPDATEPWASTLAVTRFSIPEEMAGDWQPDVGEPVTVAGHDAALSEIDGLDSGSRGPGWQVQWPVEDGMLAVAGTNMTRDEVLAAAMDVGDGTSIAAEGLPAGFTELARGPLDAAAPGLGLSHPSAGLAVTYGLPAAGDDGQTMVSIVQRPAPASAVDLLMGASLDSEVTTVRSHHGVVSRDDEVGIVVQWAEPDGQLVTVVTSGTTEQTALQIVEQLRPADPGQIEALLADYAPPSPGEFGDLAAGQVEIASGELPGGGRWRVVADPASEESMDALAIEQVSTDGSSSSGSSSGSSGGATRPLDLSTDSTGGETVVYGLAIADAATVVLETPGQEPIPLELHTVAGWNHRVVASLVPDSGTDAVAIARDAEGRELDRTTVSLGAPDPIAPDDTDPATTEAIDAAVEDVCAPAPGGMVVCSSSGTATSGTSPGDG